MADRPATVHPPDWPVYRVGRSPDPFSPPDWIFAQPDGTFGGRFDDPSARHGVPPSARFRTLYFAGTPVGAFGEVLARFRPDLTVLAAIGAAGPVPGTVPVGWRAVRRLGTTILS
ncbi:MAG: RES domain-containing protein, partial [Chloroflexota bacterium]